MTVSSTVSRVSFNGDGVTAAYTIPFLFYLTGDITVIQTSAAGVAVTLIEGQNYTLAGAGNPQGGTLSLALAVPSDGSTVQAFLDPAETQLTHYQTNTPFPSEAVEENFDRLTQMIQRLNDLLGRTITKQDGDSAGSLLLPLAKLRANGALGFDANGKLIVGPLSAQIITQALLAPFINLGQTPAEVAAGVTPVNFIDIPGNHPVGDVGRYGCDEDGSTDDVADFQNSCLVGGELNISGPMVLASASLAALTGSGINLKSNTTVRFSNGGSITITGDTPCNLFYSLNQSNIKIIDPNVVGNSEGGENTGMFWWCKADATATTDTNNNRVIRGVLSNFAANYWIYFDNFAGVSNRMRGARVKDTNLVSLSGNAQGPTNIEFPASFVGFSGNDSTGIYTMLDGEVSGLTGDGTFIKSMVNIWSGCYRIRVHDCIAHNMGTDSSVGNDSGAYAFMAYDHSHGTGNRPDLIQFSNLLVDGVRSCGIYLAGCNRVDINNFRCTGQTDTVITELPKGAIASNSVQVLKIDGVEADICAYGVYLDEEPEGMLSLNDRYVVNNVDVTNTVTNGFGVIVSGTSGGNAPDFVLRNITVDSIANGVTAFYVLATSTVGINKLSLNGFKFNTMAYGLRLNSVDSTVPALGTVHIANGEIQGFGVYGLLWNGANNALTRATFENIVLSAPQVNAAMFSVIGSYGLNVRNITLCDMTTGSGAGWYGANARGCVEGVRFRNVAQANRYVTGGADLGIVAPSGWGSTNDFVQDISTTQQGTTSSKYMRLGWQYDGAGAAWEEARVLTGN